ncbi:MAG: patatin-like phospholipase family protein [Candidatus Nitrosocosmicus sp.]
MAYSLENVLILQGGGSLGAFGCGVFKALVTNNIKLDIAAGTSIGSLNAAIISGSKDDHPEKALEQFWLELAEGNNNSSCSTLNYNFPFIERLPPEYLPGIFRTKSTLSFYCSAIYGNKKVFEPRWSPENYNDPNYFYPDKWTYLYDHSPLINTVEKYIDYNKLQPGGKSNCRLIITAVNVLSAEPLVFDSSKQQITSKHLLATTAYPTYYFKWAEVEKGVFAWDGSLLSNTPLREVIEASPVRDKRIFLIENYPKNIESLPSSLQEVQHRARDIMFSDKTLHNIHMSKAMTFQLKLINDLYNMLKDHFKPEDEEEQKRYDNILSRYKKVSEQHGAEIKGVYYITRDEPIPSLYENADFSLNTIKGSIKDGQSKTDQIIKDLRSKTRKRS